jgi:hypothetical protein
MSRQQINPIASAASDCGNEVKKIRIDRQSALDQADLRSSTRISRRGGSGGEKEQWPTAIAGPSMWQT